MTRLFERDAEVEALVAAVAAATRGLGRLVVIEGPPGRGRTALLDEAAALAEAGGLRVLRGRGRATERDFPFGLATQLLERVVAGLDVVGRAAAFAGAAAFAEPLFGVDRPSGTLTDDEHFRLVHGLYWLVANLADEQPLLLAVDDVHLADSRSLSQLLYLADRLDGLRCGLVVTTVPDGHERMLARLVGSPGARLLDLPPLSLEGVAALTTELYFPAAPSELIAAVHEQTGGEVLLVHEILSTLDQEDAGRDPGAVRRMTDRAPRSVATTLARRLDDAGRDATAFARAAVVVGNGEPAAVVAEVAGLDGEQAEKAALALLGAGVLAGADPVTFATPLMATAVAATIARTDRRELHRRAAVALHRVGRPFVVLAHHLAEVRPAGDAGVVSALWAGATEALAAGVPSQAVELLRRAVAEPAPEEIRADLLVELGTAEALAGEPDAVSHLEDAVRLHRSRTARARALLTAGQVVGGSGRAAEAVDIFGRGRAQNAPDVDVVLGLRAAELRAAIGHAATRHRAAALADEAVADAPPQGHPAGRDLLSSACVEHTLRLERIDDTKARSLALVAALAGDVERAEVTAAASVSVALSWQGDPLRAIELVTPYLDAARRRSALASFQTLAACRAIARWQLGDIAGVLDDTEVLAGQDGGNPARMAALALRARALAERGELTAAGAVVDLALDAPGWRDAVTAPMVLVTQGNLAHLLGQFEHAVGSYTAAGEVAASLGVVNPVPVPWRSGAALALGRLGDRERAAALAEEEAAIASRAGLVGAEGRALWSAGVAAGGSEATEILRRAVALLERSPARLASATAKLDLGTSLLGRRQGGEAVDHLQDAAAAATACGALRVAAKARDELERAGVTPRTNAGGSHLTAGERRVVALAVEGNTNRQIAELLFVSVKAVEWHLRNAYAKLGVANRRQLAGRVASGEVPGIASLETN